MNDSALELDELPYLFGRAWTFGDSVTAEQILPLPNHDRGLTLGRFAMSGIDSEFSRRITRGDFIVAGIDFGVGTVVKTTVRALKLAGVGGVIARSFGESFLRAATEIGLPPLQVEETAAIQTGDRLRVDIEGHKVVNLSSGDRYVIRNAYGEMLDILRAGGLAEYAAVKG